MCEGRGGYFDDIGILRDVMQNHLLQVLAVVAMEAPLQASGGDGNSFRDEKVKVLRSTAPLKLSDTVVRAEKNKLVFRVAEFAFFRSLFVTTRGTVLFTRLANTQAMVLTLMTLSMSLDT